MTAHTKNLQDERDRVDKLSSMFLPEDCVVRIRNGGAIDPVFYDNGKV